MIRRSSQLLRTGFLTGDLLWTGIAWVGAYYARFETNWIPITKDDLPTASMCWQHLPLVLLLAAVAFHATGQYAIDRLRRFRDEVICVFKGTILLSLLLLATIFLRHDPYSSRATLLLFFAFTGMGILVFRRISWAAVKTLRSRGYNQSFSLIVGSGRVARKAAHALRRASWMGIKNVGFVDERADRFASDLDLLGGFEDLPTLVQKYQISHIFIALPMGRYDDVRKVFGILSQELIDVRLVADVPALAGLTLTMTNLDGLPLVGLRENPHFGLNIVVKRAMDIVLSLAALLIFAPLMCLIAVVTKLTSPGPIFYRQERCGLNGDRFWMLKFRSMHVDAEQQTGAVWARKDDDRRTVFGSFLRKTSLDELPQLINVLIGDMSLVGPRPERPEFIDQFSKTIPSYFARHAVKAGITGWAQVHGWRGNTSLRKRIQFDLYYITHWTPWLDIKILWMTIFRGFINSNAY